MTFPQRHLLSRRHFCLCCIAGATFAATDGWLTPREAFAEARGLVSLIKDSAAVSPIVTHRLRNNVSVLEGSGGNIAVLTGPDGKVLIDAGIGVSRPQITKALAELGADPITHLINTHWHFDHADGNAWLQFGRRKDHRAGEYPQAPFRGPAGRGLGLQFPAPAAGRLPSEVFATERSLKLNGASIALKHYGPAHTDSDISVTFAEADIVHVGRHLLERHLSVHRLFDRRQHRRDDRGLRRQPGGDDRQTRSSFRATASRSATEPSSRNSATCSSPSATTSPTLKKQGRSRDETVAAKPTAAFDAKWGNFVIDPGFFTRLVYEGV